MACKKWKWYGCSPTFGGYPIIPGLSASRFKQTKYKNALPLDIISRAEWGALPPTSQETLEHPVTNVIYSYLPGRQWCPDEQGCIDTLRLLQKKQMDQGMSDIIYNFMVGRFGHLYEGRGWNVKPQKLDHLPANIDGNSINICFVGNEKSKKPTEEQWAPVFQLMRYSVKDKYVEEDYTLHETRFSLG